MSSKIDLAQVLKAYDYAESHPHKYLRGTTNWCAAFAHSLNEQAAPVVERQPLIHITPQVLGMLKGELRMQSGGITFSESAPIGNWTVPLYEAPPELAELQAIIEQLTAENERLASRVVVVEKYEDECLRLLREAEAERDQVKTEIERLKGGQGDPVAWQLDVEGYKTVTIDNYQRALSEQEHFNGRGRTAVVHNLYRSQPASVSMVRDAERYRWLRERNLEAIHEGGVFAGMTPSNVVLNGDDLDAAIDTCLDKVKEMNQ